MVAIRFPFEQKNFFAGRVVPPAPTADAVSAGDFDVFEDTERVRYQHRGGGARAE
jgi:hypothetical protein